jgi:cysteine desulfuration protein SufE
MMPDAKRLGQGGGRPDTARVSLTAKIDRIVGEFAALPEWEERYKRIIALAKRLPPMPDELKTDDRKVRGCSSTVWLHAEREGDRVLLQADSDAVLVRGLVALLVEVYSGERAEEILATQPLFIERIGLNANLSPNRANGLVSMVTQIRKHALEALMAWNRDRPTESTPRSSPIIGPPLAGRTVAKDHPDDPGEALTRR